MNPIQAKQYIRRLVQSGLLLALCLVLPFLTGQVPQIGNMLLPMHLPVLLCGYLCGAPWAAAVGFVAPLLRNLMFGVPYLYPQAVSMAFELAAYGLVVGLLWPRFRARGVAGIYAALLPAMAAGRLVWGAVRFVMLGLGGTEFSFSMFLSGAVLTAVPGILLQLVLIPILVLALKKARVLV